MEKCSSQHHFFFITHIWQNPSAYKVKLDVQIREILAVKAYNVKKACAKNKKAPHSDEEKLPGCISISFISIPLKKSLSLYWTTYESQHDEGRFFKSLCHKIELYSIQ